MSTAPPEGARSALANRVTVLLCQLEAMEPGDEALALLDELEPIQRELLAVEQYERRQRFTKVNRKEDAR